MNKHHQILWFSLVTMLIIFSVVLVFKGDFRPIPKEQTLAKQMAQPSREQQEKFKIDWQASLAPQEEPKRAPAGKLPAEEKIEARAPEMIDHRGLIDPDIHITRDEQGREIIEDDIVVTLDPKTTAEEVETMAQDLKLSVHYFNGAVGIAHFKIPKEHAQSRVDIQALLKRTYPSITAAEDNMLMTNFVLPTEHEPGKLWHLYQKWNTTVSSNNQIQFPINYGPRYDIFSKSDGTEYYNPRDCGYNVMAIVDSGFDPDHPDMAGKYMLSKAINLTCPSNNKVHSYLSSEQASCYAGGATTHSQLLASLASQTSEDPQSPYYTRGVEATLVHGHMLSNIILGFHNSSGTAGICQKGNIIPILIGALRRDQTGKVRYEFDSLQGALGIVAAVKAGAKVINVSWGTSHNNEITCDGATYHAQCHMVRAVRYAAAKGVFIASAAGNSGDDSDQNKYSPPSLSEHFNNMVSVAAHGPSGNRWAGSNYGERSIDISAPGEFIYATYFWQPFINKVPSSYNSRKGTGVLQDQQGTWVVGTSSAAPAVTAIAAMTYQALLIKLGLSPTEYGYAKRVKETLKFSASKSCPIYQSKGVSSGCLSFEPVMPAIIQEDPRGISLSYINPSADDFFDTLDPTTLEPLNASTGGSGSQSGSSSSGQAAVSSGGSDLGAGGGGGGCGFVDPGSGTPPSANFPILLCVFGFLLWIRMKWAQDQACAKPAKHCEAHEKG